MELKCISGNTKVLTNSGFQEVQNISGDQVLPICSLSNDVEQLLNFLNREVDTIENKSNGGNNG